MIVPSSQLEAMAVLKGEGRLRGTVKFYSIPGGSLLAAEVTGLPKNESGFFSLHIHEGTACTGEGFSDTRGHYDPEGKPHPLHPGDLPPLLSNQGKAYMKFLTDRFSINEILGRTLVIHAAVDNFTDQPSGNAGKKIACGIIRSV